jgi:hypothetical protein
MRAALGRPAFRGNTGLSAAARLGSVRTLTISALAALSLALSAAAGVAVTGLRGLVTRGPITPVCREGVPCSAPAKNVRLTFARGAVSRSVTTGLDGRYRVALAAGTYTVKIAGARFGYAPRSVVVLAGRVVVRNIAIDTGIR